MGHSKSREDDGLRRLAVAATEDAGFYIIYARGSRQRCLGHFFGGEVCRRDTAASQLDCNPVWAVADTLDTDEYRKVIDEVFRSGCTREFELKHLERVDAVPLRGRFVPLVAESGQVVAVLSILEGKHEVGRTEAALRESEQRFRSVLDASRDVIYRLNLKTGRYEYVSPSAVDIVGYTAEEIAAMHVDRARALICEEDLPKVSAALERLSKEGHAELEYRQRHKSGEYRWMSNHMCLVTDDAGRPMYRDGIIRDTTERKQAEQRILESEERARLRSEELRVAVEKLEATFTSLTQGVMVFDSLGRVQRMNAAAERITGTREVQWSVPANPTDRIASLRLRTEDGRIPWPADTPIGQALRGKIVQGTTFLLYNEQLAEDRWVTLSAAPVLEKGEGVFGAVAALSDITEQRRAAEALLDANEKLRQVDQRKDEFIAVLSHELRNPLAPIRNGLYVLERSIELSSSARGTLDVLQRQVVHLTRLIDDLLDVTRITNQKIHLRMELVELSELVSKVVEDHRSLFELAGVRLEVQNFSLATWVLGDAVRLAQALGNVLNNAAKFTQRSGLVRVAAFVDEKSDEPVFEIADTGAGMSAEALHRVFEPFVQAKRTLDQSRSGLGLGLALVKGIVELHGGSVRAQSAGLGLGSTFTIRLARRIREIVPSTRPNRSVISPRRRVLIIEDNVDAGNSLRDVLALEGHDALVVFDGPSGIARAREYHPDIVLCDIGLPGMSGHEVASKLRREPGLDKVRLVALSGHASPEDVARARAAGFDGHLAKPPSLGAILELLAVEASSWGDPQPAAGLTTNGFWLTFSFAG
ncbi:MAG: PAS domain S-box protein [Polyangiaceae bacterium]